MKTEQARTIDHEGELLESESQSPKIIRGLATVPIVGLPFRRLETTLQSRRGAKEERRIDAENQISNEALRKRIDQVLIKPIFFFN